jgi:hypothetical protein
MTGASRWILFTTIIVDARNHEPEKCYKEFGTNSIIVLMFVESQRVHI